MGSGRGSGFQELGTWGASGPHDFPTRRGLGNIPDPLPEEQLKRYPGKVVNVNQRMSGANGAEIGMAPRSEMTRRIE